MLTKSTEEILNPIIQKYQHIPGNLIPVLHEIQKQIGYLPPEIQEHVANQLKIPLSQVHGVITFYSFFSSTPQGEHSIGVCMGTACYVRGAEDVLERLQDELQIKRGETSADKRFTLTITRCVGTCSLAPVVMIDDKVYGNLTPEEVPQILGQY